MPRRCSILFTTTATLSRREHEWSQIYQYSGRGPVVRRRSMGLSTFVASRRSRIAGASRQQRLKSWRARVATSSRASTAVTPGWLPRHVRAGWPAVGHQHSEPHPLMDVNRRRRRGAMPRTIDFNSGDQEGGATTSRSTKNGWRCSTAVALSAPGAEQQNLRTGRSPQVTRAVLRARAVGVGIRCSTARPGSPMRQSRGAADGGRVAKPAIADALRHRARGASARAGSPFDSGTARCRPKPARPSAVAPDVQGEKAGSPTTI